MDEFAIAAYWGRTALAGAIVLGVGRLALLVARSPVTRQRLAAGTLRAAVLVPLLTLLPSWWAITVPATPPTPVVEVVAAEPMAVAPEPPPVEWVTVPEFVEVEPPAFVEVEPTPVVVEPEPVAVVVPPREFTWRDAVAVLAAGYAVGVAYFLGVFALGHLALVRLRRGATVAPNRVRAVWSTRRPPALLVHGGLASPVCFGVVRPAVVLPAALAQSATAEQLTWVLAHEADHLRRGDPLTGWFAGLAKALFFFAPWFWGVRRELRLAQEYLADAAALAAGGHAADYAEFLVDLTAAPVRGRRTSLAHGVRAGRSDLSRRITMVLSTTPPRATRRWATPAAAGLFAVAVALSGVTVVRADDKPTPAEKVNESRRDGWLIYTKPMLLQDKPKPAEAAPQPLEAPKPPEPPAEAKPARVVEIRNANDLIEPLRWSYFRSDKITEQLRKQIDEALAAGKTDDAKKLIDALVKSLTPPMPPAAPTPPTPPQPPARGPRSVLAIEVADPRIADALTVMRKAIDATKDPEARAAMESAFKLLRDMPQERKLTQTFVGPDGRETVVQHGPGFGGSGAPGMRGGPGGIVFPAGGMPGMPANDGGVRLRDANTFGLTVEPLPEVLAAQLQFVVGFGVVVTEVRPDSPFATAGVKKSDVITSVNSVRLAGGATRLWQELSKASGKSAVTVVSRGVERMVEVVLPQTKEGLARPAKKVRFDTMRMEIVNRSVLVEARDSGTQYKITGVMVGDNQLDNAVITITDTKTGKATTQSGTVLTEMDERDRAAVTTLLTQIRGQ